MYTEEHANIMKSRAEEKYRPSNGIEGVIFIEDWCVRCRKDANEDCQILSDTYIFDVTDERYPSEWVYGEDGQPKCTAFYECANGSLPRCDKTKDMFGG